MIQKKLNKIAKDTNLFLKRFITKQKKNKFDSCNEIWPVFWRKKDKIKNFN